MTSLYRALRSGQPVETKTDKGKPIERVYYLDIAACLEPSADREDAVISLHPERIRRTNFNRDIAIDVSTPEKEYERGYFPLSVIFDNAAYEWNQGYRTFHNYDKDKMTELDRFEREVIQRFRQYRVPTIELTQSSTKEAVCQVFEKVNTGGVALTVFELMTATFAADDYDLREDWDQRHERLKDRDVLRGVAATEFLQAVTLLASYRRKQHQKTAVSCKRKDILELTLDEYRAGADPIEAGLVRAAQLLHREKIFARRNLPYASQLVPLAAICAVLGDRFDNDTVKQKLTRWYWCGVFGELYGGTTDTRIANDITDVLTWIDKDEHEPRTVRDANFAPIRLLTLQTRLSAAYKGMMALLMQAGSKDFINGDSIEVTTFFEKAVDIHHIFPRAYCQKQGHPKAKWNSIINKAPLTGRTNRILGGHAPSRYVASIEKKHNVASERLDEILTTHLTAPTLLRRDDFDAFILDRARQLLDLIEKAMGKTILGRDGDDVMTEYGAALVASSSWNPPAGEHA